MSEQSEVDEALEDDELEETNEPTGEEQLLDIDFETTEEISVPDSLIDQVIGQERARDIVKKAAKQHRHVMMIGPPGTGKSMLAKAMTELLPKEDMQDVLVYPNDKDENEPRIRTVPNGKGEQIVGAHRKEANKQKTLRSIVMWVIIIGILGYGFFFASSLLWVIVAAIAVFLFFKFGLQDIEADMPNLLIDNSDEPTAPFENATGAHSGAILGDVRHDPFQSGGMQTPAHERVEAGAIHKSHKGVLFVDEINTLGVRDQQKLMTAIQEGEFGITGQSERSSGAMVQTQPVPTDFIMVAAGNQDALENMHPALRSRLKGYGYEVYMEDTIDDTLEKRREYAQFVAQEVTKDEHLPHFTKEAVEEMILEARRRAGRKGKLTLELRDLGGLVRVAGDIARAEGAPLTDRNHVLQAKNRSRSIEQQMADEYIEQRKDYEVERTEDSVIGRVNGLAVMGEDSGIVLPVMASVAPSQGPGGVTATGKLQDIAQEAVENVSAVIKKFSEEDISDKDIHIQFVQTYEGVQGDSASVTVATAVISALEGIEIDQSVAMTGSLSVRGDVLPVGGVTHKIESAAKAGMEEVIIPAANEKDVMIEEEYKDQIEIVPVSTLSEVLEVALVEDSPDSPDKKSLLSRLAEATGNSFNGNPPQPIAFESSKK